MRILWYIKFQLVSDTSSSSTSFFFFSFYITHIVLLAARPLRATFCFVVMLCIYTQRTLHIWYKIQKKKNCFFSCLLLLLPYCSHVVCGFLDNFSFLSLSSLSRDLLSSSLYFVIFLFITFHLCCSKKKKKNMGLYHTPLREKQQQQRAIEHLYISKSETRCV